MIFFQVEDIKKAFSDLCTLEANGWTKLEPMQIATKSITKTKSSICKKVCISMYTFGVSVWRQRLLDGDMRLVCTYFEIIHSCMV